MCQKLNVGYFGEHISSDFADHIDLCSDVFELGRSCEQHQYKDILKYIKIYF